MALVNDFILIVSLILTIVFWFRSDDYLAAKEVPCHHEFYKIIQWHNYVVESLEHLNIPHGRFYMEDLKSNYQNQVERFLDFFEITPIVKVSDSKYEDYFEKSEDLFKPEDKMKIKGFIETVATNKTLALLNRYFTNL